MRINNGSHSDIDGVSGDLARRPDHSTPANTVQDIFENTRPNRQEAPGSGSGVGTGRLGRVKHGSLSPLTGGMLAAEGPGSPAYGDGSAGFTEPSPQVTRRPVGRDAAVGEHGCGAAGRRFSSSASSPFNGLGSPNKWAGVFTFIRWAFAVWRDTRNGRIC